MDGLQTESGCVVASAAWALMAMISVANIPALCCHPCYHELTPCSNEINLVGQQQMLQRIGGNYSRIERCQFSDYGKQFHSIHSQPMQGNYGDAITS